MSGIQSVKYIHDCQNITNITHANVKLMEKAKKKMFNRDDQIVQANLKGDGLLLCFRGLKVKDYAEGTRLDSKFKGKLCLKGTVISFCIISAKISA